MKPSKQERNATAERTREERRLHATNDLSIALLRCLSVKRIFEDEFAAMMAEGSSINDLRPIPIDSLEPNRKTRGSTMVLLYYATLNVVIEGWEQSEQPEPRLADAQIDNLLTSPFTRILKDFRNSVSHPNSAVDRRILAFHQTHAELAVWADALCREFQRYFIGWRESVGFPTQRRD